LILPGSRLGRWWGVLLLGGLLALAAVAGCSDKTDSAELAAEEVSEEVLIKGKMVYLTRCVGCHGVDGVGIVGPDIRPGKVLEKYASAEAMEAVVRDGLGEMPEFGSKLTDDEIAAVVAYVRGGLG